MGTGTELPDFSGTASVSLLFEANKPNKHKHEINKSPFFFAYKTASTLEDFALEGVLPSNHASPQPWFTKPLQTPFCKQKHVHAAMLALACCCSSFIQQSCPGTALPLGTVVPTSSHLLFSCVHSCWSRDLIWLRMNADTWRIYARLKLRYSHSLKACVYIRNATKKCHNLFQYDFIDK